MFQFAILGLPGCLVGISTSSKKSAMTSSEPDGLVVRNDFGRNLLAEGHPGTQQNLLGLGLLWRLGGLGAWGLAWYFQEFGI